MIADQEVLGVLSEIRTAGDRILHESPRQPLLLLPKPTKIIAPDEAVRHFENVVSLWNPHDPCDCHRCERDKLITDLHRICVDREHAIIDRKQINLMLQAGNACQWDLEYRLFPTVLPRPMLAYRHTLRGQRNSTRQELNRAVWVLTNTVNADRVSKGELKGLIDRLLAHAGKLAGRAANAKSKLRHVARNLATGPLQSQRTFTPMFSNHLHAAKSRASSVSPQPATSSRHFSKAASLVTASAGIMGRAGRANRSAGGVGVEATRSPQLETSTSALASRGSLIRYLGSRIVDLLSVGGDLGGGGRIQLAARVVGHTGPLFSLRPRLLLRRLDRIAFARTSVALAEQERRRDGDRGAERGSPPSATERYEAERDHGRGSTGTG